MTLDLRVPESVIRLSVVSDCNEQRAAVPEEKLIGILAFSL